MFIDYIGVPHLDLQVQQSVVCSDSCFGHMHIYRTDNSDPKVRRMFGRRVAQTLGRGESSSQDPNRIYAVTGKSRPIAVAFAVITTSQLALGIHHTSVVAAHPGEP